MYVCICNAVTDREIRQCAELGARTVDELRDALGVASCCGKCEGVAREILAGGAGSGCARAAAPA
ncbi:MAG: (2Fe-2S)-binding protein [Burkholderiales bacterium]